VTPLHYSLFALEPQHGPSFSLSLLMQVHEAAAVVESGGDAGDAVAIRRRLCGGEGPVGMLGGGGPVETPVHQVGSPELPAPSTLPVGDGCPGVRRTMSSVARGGDFGEGYSQSEFFFDSTCSCAPRVFAAPVRGRRAA